MSEIWDLYDIDKNITGELIERTKEREIPKGRYHLVVDIWTVEGKKILLTQRHPKKPYGLMWECTGGSVIKGETSIEGAIRELREETGIVVSSGDLELIGEEINERSIVESYVYRGCVSLGELQFQKDEVVDAKYVSLDELEDMNVHGLIAEPVWNRFKILKNKIIK